MFWLRVPLSGTDLKSLDTDVGFKSSPPPGSIQELLVPTLTMGCWAGSGVYEETCLSLSYPFWCEFCLPASQDLLSKLLGFFQRNCSVWSWGVRVSVDGVGSGSPYGTLWNGNPCSSSIFDSKTLTGHPDWRGTDRRGWEVYGHTTLNVPNPVWGAGERLPHCPSLPHLYVGLHCALRSERVHLQACR